MSGAGIRMDLSGFDFAGLRDVEVDAAMHAGADVIMEAAIVNVPKESGDLAASAAIKPGRGGQNFIGLGFDSVYASYIHEHLAFRHPHGGRAKYLEAAMLERKDDALDAMARRLFRGA